MRRVPGPVRGLFGLLLCWWTAPLPASAEPAFDLQLLPLQGDGPPEAGRTLRVRLALRDATTGYPLSGLHPGGWFRPAVEGRTPCRTAVSAYLAAGANAVRDIDLNGYAFLSLHADDTVGLVDPRLDLATSNLVWLERLPERPAGWALDHGEARLFLSLPDRGEIRALDLHGGDELWRASVGRPGPPLLLERDGSPVVADEAAGAVLQLDPATGAILGEAATLPGRAALAADEERGRLFVLPAGSARLFEIDLRGMRVVGRYEVPAEASRLAYSPRGDVVVFAPAGDEALGLLHVDGSELRSRVQLAGAADALLLAPDGRWLFALDRGRGIVSVVDLARGRLRHALVFPDRPDRMAASGDYLYLRQTGAPRLDLVHIGSLDDRREPGVLAVALGSKPPATALPDGPSPVAPLPEGGGALVAGEADRTLFLATETGMQAPANAFRLWTEPPVAVAVFDRSLRETRPGVYEATLRFPGPGRWEFLLHLPQPAFAACRVVEIRGLDGAVGEQAASPDVELKLSETPVEGEPLAFDLELRDRRTGRRLAARAELSVLAMREGTSWFRRLRARAVDGRARVELPPVEPGIYRLFVESAALRLSFEHARLPPITVRPREETP